MITREFLYGQLEMSITVLYLEKGETLDNYAMIGWKVEVRK